jgi:hypothetical protein
MRRSLLSLASALLSLCLLAPPASAEFGFKETGLSFSGETGTPSLLAGSHPFAMETTTEMNAFTIPEGESCEFPLCELPDGQVEDITVTLPEGLVGDPRAVPRCPSADFLVQHKNYAACPDSSVVGYLALRFSFAPVPAGVDLYLHVPVYSLTPPPGVALRLGFVPLEVPVTIDVTINPNPPYNVVAHATSISQVALFEGSLLTLWGDPGSPAHDPFRSECLDPEASPRSEPVSAGSCPIDIGERRAFLTLPRSCTGALETHFHALAWISGKEDDESALTEPGMVDCTSLKLDPRISTQPTSQAASSPTGLDFGLHLDDPGITSPTGRAKSDIKTAVVTLPEGMTANPSQAEGLAVCTEAEFARETATSTFGAGCPPASKIGTVEVGTPLLEGEALKGSLFVAVPFTNRFRTLLALFMTVKSPELGIGVRLAGKVVPDPRTGQLITTFGAEDEALPQLPFSDFRLHFREGGRSPQIAPERCGTYYTKATFTPWANPTAPYTTTSSFEITRGPGGGSCPPAGPPPFAPGFSAGSLANDAASFSPFHMRLIRNDGEQDMTRFSATLPPGLVGKLAGIEQCPDAAIAAVKAKTGKQELASPSCPANSQIGTTIAGAGAGSQLTYVPGKLYLAGPLGSSPLSVVAITPAVAGPFDVGTVVVREALDLNPRTAEVEVNEASSDPIPHILAGIPLKLRDLRVHADRPDFILNPTSCEPFQTRATLFGSYLDVFNPADDVPVSLAAHFQAANCANLGFRPRLFFKLKGGTRRGANPALRAVLSPRPGDANLASTVVRFPPATFLDQAHIRTVCTRVQFAADACPEGAIYGHVKAFTPLLSQPLEGPVYLRSSNHPLPDIVFALQGLVDVEATARADSVRGRLRVSFSSLPDAPVSKVVVQMQGAKKGLLVNSRDICEPVPRASVAFGAQNGRRRGLRSTLQARRCALNDITHP